MSEGKWSSNGCGGEGRCSQTVLYDRGILKKKCKEGAKNVVQWLRTFIVFAKDPDFFPAHT